MPEAGLRGVGEPTRRRSPSKRLRGSRVVMLGSALCALLVVAGCSTVPGRPVAAANTSPFYAAVVDLLTQSAAHYTGSDSQGASWDVRATSGGEMLGKVTTAGQQTDVLTVDGKTYVKPPATKDVPNLPRGLSTKSVRGKWITGSDDLGNSVPAGVWSPRQLATELLHALDQTTAYPRVGDDTVRVGSDLAYEVATPTGTLAVSATAPHRLLRWIPAPATKTSSSTVPTTAAWDVSSTTTTQPVGPISFVLMTPADREQAFNDIAAQTQTLTDAVNIGIQFDFNQTGNLNCSETSCTVSTNVTTSTTATRGATLTGNVSAAMKAAITVDGTPSGGCATTQSLPISGSSVMTCIDPTIAPLVAQVNARKQAEADAQARAQHRDVTVEYNINFQASIDIQAVAIVQAEIDRLVTLVRTEQDGARNRTSCGQNCNYQQVPYNSDKLSQAAYRARQAGNTTPSRNIIVALVPGFNDPKTGDLVIGSGDGQSDNPSGRSEDDVVNQLTAKGFKAEQITGLYSERQPCFATCGSKLGLKPEAPVSYTIPWIANDAQALSAGNDLLTKLTAEGGGAHK
ncbi:nucleic acid/nucleotide deaminase domain-containing protein [Nocardia sp. NPDC051030]|uniref:nucleic acid/nucleotide deaminase domain-containing protein n=1 Tax=Nocardia sp. NPDC051030 TaxID=3155162 RepID=UPI00344AEA34